VGDCGRGGFGGGEGEGGEGGDGGACRCGGTFFYLAVVVWRVHVGLHVVWETVCETLACHDSADGKLGHAEEKSYIRIRQMLDTDQPARMVHIPTRPFPRLPIRRIRPPPPLPRTTAKSSLGTRPAQPAPRPGAKDAGAEHGHVRDVPLGRGQDGERGGGDDGVCGICG
jgi:hypothetical protein